MADPMLAPVIVGCTDGLTPPAAIVMLAGDTVAIDVLLLERVKVTPPVGAGVNNVIGNDVEVFNPTVGVLGIEIIPGGFTVTVPVASAIPVGLLASIVEVPTASAVTGTVVVFEPDRKVAVAGTVATLVSLEPRLTVIPPVGAAADNVSVMLAVLPTTRLSGVTVTVAVTWVDCVAVV